MAVLWNCMRRVEPDTAQKLDGIRWTEAGLASIEREIAVVGHSRVSGKEIDNTGRHDKRFTRVTMINRYIRLEEWRIVRMGL